MNDWMAIFEPLSAVLGVFLGLLSGLIAVLWVLGKQRKKQHMLIEEKHEQAARLSALQASHKSLLEQRDELRMELQQTGISLGEAQTQRARLETRLQEKEASYQRQLEQLHDAEARLTESFENIAGKLFEDRSKKFSELSQTQMDNLLKPLREQLTTFDKMVTSTSKQEAEQHAALREKINQLEVLNRDLADDAKDLTRALTRQSKAQGGWGELQLERLLESAGLEKGIHFATQYSVITEAGNRIQPDVVLKLPEEKSIIMDAKVSLVDWTRYSAADDEQQREQAFKAHVASIKRHIDGLSEKRYAEVPELNALDFVLMFVPIEAALAEAVNRERGLAEYALERKVALMSPANLLVTLRTMASIWQIHKQNTYARDIADRAGKLYDKFAGFAENIQVVGQRLDQAQSSWQGAIGQLSEGPGNVLRQIEMLKDLGARTSKQIDEKLLQQSRADDSAAMLDADTESDLAEE